VVTFGFTLVLLLSASIALAGCAAHSAAPSPAAAVQAHAGERYAVYRVDRNKFDKSLWPTTLASPFKEKPGTIVVDTANHHLYLILPDGMSRRFGVAVGDSGKAWKGRATIGRKALWPTWYPTDEMRKTTAELPARIAPGPANPLGARALYLYQSGRDTLYRIHGTSEPWTIGTDASSGCIRMINEDAIELFDLVQTGAQVVVI